MAKQKTTPATTERDQRQDNADFKWEQYAKQLTKLILSDPNKVNQQQAQFIGKYSQATILNYLTEPASHEKELRNASIYMSMVQTRYSRLIQYYAGLPTYNYVIAPLNFNPLKYDADKFRKNFLKVAQKLELMNIKDEIRKQIVVTLREGVFYGVRWGDSLSGFVQQLNADYCKITAISDGVFQFDVDMSKIKENQLGGYPEEFRDMYDAYKRTGVKWQHVDPDLSVCIKADPTTTAYSIPPFAGVLPELYTINSVQAVQDVANEMDNYKLIAGKVDLDDEGVPVMDYDLVMKYYDHIASNIGDKVGLAIAPFDLHAIDFSKSATADAVDKVAQAVDNFWGTCGTSALLHGSGADTAGALKLAIKSDESFVFAILDQCERQLNRYLKTAMPGSTRFKITFLRESIFNQDDVIAQYKGGLNYGIGKSHYMAALGILQSDIAGLIAVEDDVIGVDNLLTVLKTSSTLSSEDVSGDKQNGRPLEDEDDLEESGEITRENDSNENR